ncbi:hypothetical protein TAC_0004 [Acinetobacter phage TAC1]|nr:hypothetical protein TAC_0004 [Acinetobacter phage TAC1]
MELKDGDKIICIDDSGQKVVKKGSIYTVKELDISGDRDRVWIKDYKRFSFKISRFEKVVRIEGGICDN